MSLRRTNHQRYEKVGSISRVCLILIDLFCFLNAFLLYLDICQLRFVVESLIRGQWIRRLDKRKSAFNASELLGSWLLCCVSCYTAAFKVGLYVNLLWKSIWLAANYHSTTWNWTQRVGIKGIKTAAHAQNNIPVVVFLFSIFFFIYDVCIAVFLAITIVSTFSPLQAVCPIQPA